MAGKNARERQMRIRLDGGEGKRQPKVLRLRTRARAAVGTRASTAGGRSHPHGGSDPMRVLHAHRALLAKRLSELEQLAHQPVLRLPGADAWLSDMEQVGLLATEAVNGFRRSPPEQSMGNSLGALVRLVCERIAELHREVCAASLARRAVLSFSHALKWFMRLGAVVESELQEVGGHIQSATQLSERAYVFLPTNVDAATTIAAHGVNLAQLVAQVCLRTPHLLEMDSWGIIACLVAHATAGLDEQHGPRNRALQEVLERLPVPVRRAVEAYTQGSGRKAPNKLAQVLLACDAVLAAHYVAGREAGPVSGEDLARVSRDLCAAKPRGIDVELLACAAAVPLWMLLLTPGPETPGRPSAAQANAA